MALGKIVNLGDLEIKLQDAPDADKLTKYSKANDGVEVKFRNTEMVSPTLKALSNSGAAFTIQKIQGDMAVLKDPDIFTLRQLNFSSQVQEMQLGKIYQETQRQVG